MYLHQVCQVKTYGWEKLKAVPGEKRSGNLNIVEAVIQISFSGLGSSSTKKVIICQLRFRDEKRKEPYPCVKAIVNPVPSIRQVLNLGGLVELGQPGEQGVADAAEGRCHAQDLVHVLVHKLEAFVDQVGDLEEGGGDEDGDDAGRFKGRLFCRVRMLCPAPRKER